MKRLACALLATTSLLSLGCATQPTKTTNDPRDPWERLNRKTYAFNDAIDRTVLRPVAQTYHRVTPHFVQTGVSNFLDNLQYPVVIVNDVLQGKLKPAASDTGRLLLNTTVGIGGLFDVASKAGMDKGDEDFGQTLGKWGVQPGPYLVLPLLGFSTVRDSFGRLVDNYMNPRHYIRDSSIYYGLIALDVLDTRSRLLSTDETVGQAYDPYAFIRNVWLQRREYQVKDGNVAEQPANEEPLDDPDPGASQDGGKSGAPPESKPDDPGKSPAAAGKSPADSAKAPTDSAKAPADPGKAEP